MKRPLTDEMIAGGLRSMGTEKPDPAFVRRVVSAAVLTRQETPEARAAEQRAGIAGLVIGLAAGLAATMMVLVLSGYSIDLSSSSHMPSYSYLPVEDIVVPLGEVVP